MDQVTAVAVFAVFVFSFVCGVQIGREQGRQEAAAARADYRIVLPRRRWYRRLWWRVTGRQSIVMRNCRIEHREGGAVSGKMLWPDGPPTGKAS